MSRGFPLSRLDPEKLHKLRLVRESGEEPPQEFCHRIVQQRSFVQVAAHQRWNGLPLVGVKRECHTDHTVGRLEGRQQARVPEPPGCVSFELVV
jgi:hypothetical protein